MSHEHDLGSSPMWTAKHPFVAELYRLIHTNAIQHQGKAFTFDFLLQREAQHYRYNCGLFSSEWVYQPLYSSSGLTSQMQEDFKAACRSLSLYIEGYRYRPVAVSDGRTNTAQSNATAIAVTEHYMTISVNQLKSWSIYECYYQSGGAEFKKRLQSAHADVLHRFSDQVISLLTYSFSPSATNGQKFMIPIEVTNTGISCHYKTSTYEQLGFVPLTRLYQCYGLFFALIEDILGATKGIANFSPTVSIGGPYRTDKDFGFRGQISFEFQKKLAEW